MDVKTISKVVTTKGIAPPLTGILESLEGLKSGFNKGDATFDSACSARKFCTLLKDLGWTPIFKPKSNTTSNAKGSRARKGTVQTYRNDRDQLDGRHCRRIVEAAYSAIKAMCGASLRTRLAPTPTAEANDACHTV